MDEVLKAVRSMVKRWAVLNFVPILEADVAGWLFHCLLEQLPDRIANIHVDTRVCDGGRRKYDVAVGNLELDAQGRPRVQPELVVQIKLFPEQGFNAQAHYRHLQEIKDRDLPSLHTVLFDDVMRIELIVDAKGHLLRGEIERVNRCLRTILWRDEIAPLADLVFMIRDNHSWHIVHVPSLAQH